MEVNIYITQGNTGYLNILKHNCDISFEKLANTQTYKLQYPSQHLCRMVGCGHHHVDICTSSRFGDTNRKTWDQTDNFLLV